MSRRIAASAFLEVVDGIRRRLRLMLLVMVMVTCSEVCSADVR